MASTIIEMTPINRVALCSNIPFDSTYTHTILFGTADAQLAYFMSHKKYLWENLTPSRFPNKLRLPLPASDVYNCNYCVFQNTNFNGKWMYAFITGIEYENPSCCLVTIELDAFQTWQFEMVVGTSYVLREHPLTDAYGEHTLGEPLETGEFVDGAAQKTGHFETYRAVVEYAGSTSSGGSGGGDTGGEDNGHGPGWENTTRESRATGQGTVGGTFSGLQYMSASLSGAGGGAILDLLESLNNSGKIDQIAATYLMPDDFYTTSPNPLEYTLTVPKQITSLGEYTPRNKKLLCYPYNMLCVSNSMGEINTYKWEYFYNKGSAALFGMGAAMGANTDVILWPISYNGKAENWQETMSLTGFPQFAYIIDTYRNWVAQSGSSFALQQLAGIGSSLGSAVVNAASGNLMETITSGLSAGAGMAAWAEKSKMPNSSGGASGSNSMVGLRAKDFYFYQHHIREDYAKTFDDFFDRFGYQTNRLKVPNLSGRPGYNYVQLAEGDIHGNVPLNDINTIKQAFNRGITFWHNSARVGDYSLRNRPEGEEDNGKTT